MDIQDQKQQIPVPQETPMLGLIDHQKKLKRKKGFNFSKFSFSKKKTGVVLGVLAVVLLIIGAVGYFAVYVPAMRIQAKAQDVKASGEAVKAAFKANDIDLVEAKLKITEAKYDAFQKEASSVYWLGAIPFAGAYAQDFKNGVEAGDHLLDAAKKTIVAIKPHADLIGFKKGEDVSFVDKSAEERLQTAVLTLDSIVEDVDSIAADVDKARDNIAKIDPKRYPKNVKGIALREEIANGKDQFEGIASLFVDSKPFIKALPDILGSEKKKTYLFLFQNDNELRATGGFLTAYSVFEVDQGKFSVVSSDDIYTLDNSIKIHPAAPREIATYHKGVPKLQIRDSNLSPDFPTSVGMFEELYRTSSKATKYDGIIAVDTEVLVNALEILGDTQARGLNFTSRIDKRCDCPGVIYTLLDEIDRPVAYLKTDRKGILGDLLLTLMQKALGFSPSRYWGRLSQMMIKDIQEKHILIYMTDPAIQKSLVAMNFAGQIRPFDGDYLHISDVNFAGAKSNLYVKHDVKSETTIAGDGSVERKLTITYRNPKAHSNCNMEDGGGLGRGGLCINATLRNWVRVFVPEGSTLVEFKGSEMKTQTYEDLGKTVFEGFLGVKPEGKAEVTVTYKLPFKVANEEDYKLMIQKQPGTDAHTYSVSVNGSLISNTPLITDQVIRVK